jgi:hypothetical protein
VKARVLAGIVVTLALLAAYLYIKPPVRVAAVSYIYTGYSAGIFFEARNLGLSEVCIVDAYLEGVNAKVELHETVKEGGVARMTPVDRVCIPPLGTVEFRHGGLHVMVMGGMDPGGKTLVLVLDDGREVKVELPSKPSG